ERSQSVARSRIPFDSGLPRICRSRSFKNPNFGLGSSEAFPSTRDSGFRGLFLAGRGARRDNDSAFPKSPIGDDEAGNEVERGTLRGMPHVRGGSRTCNQGLCGYKTGFQILRFAASITRKWGITRLAPFPVHAGIVRAVACL